MNDSNEKILIIPSLKLNVRKGGPFAVVKAMYNAELLSKSHRFEFIESKLLSHNISRTRDTFENFKAIKTSNIYWILKFFIKGRTFLKKYEQIIKKYDKMICHDLTYGFWILKRYPGKKVLSVYHGQGSLYYERVDLAENKKDYFLKKFADSIECFVYGKSFACGFPSNGAIDALLETNRKLKNILDSKRVYIFHNGINCNEIENAYEESELTEKIQKKNIIFTTVGPILNEAKGVERIPEFLGLAKKRGIRFQWIVIGKGKNERRLEIEIKKNNIQGETLWFKKFFEHSKVITLLKKSDIYIMFHRKSIFDLTILEAMYCRNLPILTNVGGNKELNIDNNVILLNSLWEAKKVVQILQNCKSLSYLKEKNRKIVLNYFTLKHFNERYKKVFDKKE